MKKSLKQIVTLAVVAVMSVMPMTGVTAGNQSNPFVMEAQAASTVTIGHASISEHGTINGTKGDQTGKEVCKRSWYSKPWTVVIRPKNTKDAEKIAKAMEQACANNKIGYGQSDRTTLYTQASKAGWNLSAIKTACNTDCSALVSVCVNAAGIKVSKDIYTGNEKKALLDTGKFTAYTSSAYTGSTKNLKRGDILLGSGHTAIVLTSGSSSGSTSSNTKYFSKCASSYTSIVDALKSVGCTDTSLTYRKKIAAANGISNYSGTASQNISMLNLLKQGKLIKP